MNCQTFSQNPRTRGKSHLHISTVSQAFEVTTTWYCVDWRENFLGQSELSMLTFIQFPFKPRVTAVARKRPRSFCQKCKWQVTPKRACTLGPMKSQWTDFAAVQA